MNLEDLFPGSLSLPDEQESDALAALPACRGVLLFTDGARRPIRMTYCANLRRTAQTRLVSDPEVVTRSADLSAVTAQVWFLPCRTEYESFRQYIRLARFLFPEALDETVSLPPAHSVVADPDEPWGAFACTDQPLQKASAVYFGLFPSRRHADAFAQAWNTTFGLCRNRRLALAGKGRQCSYLQMGLCPGPCLDADNAPAYRRTLMQAVEAASKPPRETIDLLTIEMRQKAANMEFERAQLLKKQIEQLSELTGGAYRWTGRLSDLEIVHIDQSCFRVKKGRRKIPVFCIYEMDARQAALRRELTLEEPDEGQELASNLDLPPLKPKEHLGLLSYYLYRSSPPGLWMKRHRYSQQSEDQLREMLEATFLSKKAD